MLKECQPHGKWMWNWVPLAKVIRTGGFKTLCYKPVRLSIMTFALSVITNLREDIRFKLYTLHLDSWRQAEVAATQNQLRSSTFMMVKLVLFLWFKCKCVDTRTVGDCFYISLVMHSTHDIWQMMTWHKSDLQLHLDCIAMSSSIVLHLLPLITMQVLC